MKILLVFKNKQAQAIVLLALESKFKVEMQEADNAEHAILKLNERVVVGGTPYDLVIAEHSEFKQRLLQYNESLPHSRLKWIFWKNQSDELNSEQNTDYIRHFDQHDSMDSFFAIVDSLYSSTDDGVVFEPPNLCRIACPLLLATSPLLADIYIRLSPTKLIKIFHQGDVFDREDLEKYHEKKKIEYFYIRQERTREFLNRLRDGLLRAAVFINAISSTSKSENEIEDLKKEAVKDTTIDVMGLARQLEKNPASVHEALHEVSKVQGFTPEVQDLIKTCVLTTVSSIRKNPRLSDVLSTLDRDKNKYIANHSLLLAHVACMVGSQMDWKSDSTYQKLTIAALLHDLPLKNQELAAIDTLKELEEKKSSFSAEELKEFKSHPIVAAEYVKSFAEIPPDVDIILAEHHERPDGTGFPKGYNHQRIAALSAVFIVSHDLVTFILSKNSGNEIKSEVFKQFTEKYGEVYTLGNFRKALRAIMKISA